jgi:hypothetical protein
MQENKFQNNKGMVNYNLNTPSIWCILVLKPPLYAIVVDCNLVYINVIYVVF